MKIIRLKHSILFLNINTKIDTVKCLFVFFVSWNCFKIDKRIFELKTLTASQIKLFYKDLANDYNRIYRV